MSEMAPFSQAGINMQYLDRATMLHSSYTQKTNPLFAGLITPPDTPIRSVDSSAPQSPTSSTLEASRSFGSTNDVQKAMEALSVAIRSASVESFGQDASVASSAAVSPSVALFDLENVREDIYSIVEHTVEAKMSDAMGPLRLNINKLDDSLEAIRHREDALNNLESHLRREHTDIREQNDTLSRQIDLHYRTIEQNVEEFKSQSKTMNTLIGAQADQSKIMSTMIGAQADMLGHLSQLINNLPVAINQVVHNAVQQQAQLAIRDIMFAQQQAMFSVSDVSGARKSVSSDGSSSQCTCMHHRLDIESMASTHNKTVSIAQPSPRSCSKSSRGFTRLFRKLFRSSKARHLL